MLLGSLLAYCKRYHEKIQVRRPDQSIRDTKEVSESEIRLNFFGLFALEVIVSWTLIAVFTSLVIGGIL